ncbi:MAG: tRNA (guanosine(37)-N1)-methyltransferase TrmD, partial [Candidatus Sumerlaeaceae bacterium]
HDSFSGEGLLDYPHYTRPPVFRGHGIPEVLLSGHHKKIEEWRRRQSLERTLKRRPDIIENVLPQLREEERQFIKELRARLQQDSCDNAETQREP